jgi:hypothetical protein
MSKKKVVRIRRAKIGGVKIGGAKTAKRGSKEGAVALAFATFGRRVLPIYGALQIDDDEPVECDCGDPDCETPGRHPIPRNGVADATTDLLRICDWWIENPHASVGVVTDLGSQPPEGGFVVIAPTLSGTDHGCGSVGHRHDAVALAAINGPWVSPEEADRALGLPRCSVCHIIAGDPAFHIIHSGKQALIRLDDLREHADRIRQLALAVASRGKRDASTGCPLKDSFVDLDPGMLASMTEGRPVAVPGVDPEGE